MRIPSGSTLGPYTVLELVGAGGMGEVYRARDARLDREVAIKILPGALAADADRLRRFEQEARSASRINHPNILAVYDLGTHEGQPYVVTEYLQGETLRQRLADGALPVRKSIELGIALAYGLAAAHEQGIVHRDLKPENLFITTDGRLKILDFGLAKLTRPEDGADGRTAAATLPADTDPGTVMGTVGYMSPEQVRGQTVDHRSDIFAFGAILYETVSGQRAFKGESPADTTSAILREDPPDLTTLDTEIPLALERVVRHCLEKAPGERFRSAHDLAFQLEGISSLSGTGAMAAAEADAPAPAPRVVTHFEQLTHWRGPIWSARFAPDGQTILYAAEWNGEATKLYMRRSESPDAIPLATPGIVGAVSRTGEVAILLEHRFAHNGVFEGTLALAPMFGGAPRLVAEHIQFVDFSPNGSQLMVSRDAGGQGRIEYPLGTVVYETKGHVSFPRLSPTGDRVAFFEHPLAGDDRGSLSVIDLEGNHKQLTPEWTSAQGLAWSPDGTEIWFTVAPSGSTRSLFAVKPDGSQRFISGFPGTVRIQDIAPDGRVILTRDSLRVGLIGKAAGEERERDLSWLDWSLIGDLSRDGTTVLFDEENEQIGRDYLVCIRKLDGSPVIRLGQGRACSLSPDGRWAVSRLPRSVAPLVLLPTGAGQPREIPSEGVQFRTRIEWLPDSRRFLVVGRAENEPPRLYMVDIESGGRTPVGPELPTHPIGFAVSPDGAEVVVVPRPGDAFILTLADGATRPLKGAEGDFEVSSLSADGVHLILRELHKIPLAVHRLDIRTGVRELWRTLMPEESGGVISVFNPKFARDSDAYAYGYSKVLSELYSVRGLS